MKQQFKSLFTGIGEIQVPPIQLYMKAEAKPVAQKQRPIPVHMMGLLKENIDEFLKAGVLEGPLGFKHARG